jgi:hypothetical protein
MPLSLGTSVFLSASTGASITIAALTYPDIPDPSLPHHYRVELRQSGGDIAGTFYVDGVAYPVSVIGQTLGTPFEVVLNPLHVAIDDDQITGTIVALAFYNSTTIPDHFSAMSGYAGELATTRITRLCLGDGIADTIAGPTTSVLAVGAQAPDTTLNLVREAIIAEEGVITERRGGQLGFDLRAYRENQTTGLALDNSLFQLSPDFIPVDDDQRARNYITLTRKNGITVPVTDTTGPLRTTKIGTLGTAPIRNLATDAQAFFTSRATPRCGSTSPGRLSRRSLPTGWRATSGQGSGSCTRRPTSRPTKSIRSSKAMRSRSTRRSGTSSST